MDKVSEQDLSSSLKNMQIKTIEKIIIKENKKKPLLLYIFLFAFLLIPVLSIEGIVGWFLGISGAYKTIKLYRSEEKSRSNKSLKLLIIYILIAAVYNILAYYGQLIF